MSLRNYRRMVRHRARRLGHERLEPRLLLATIQWATDSDGFWDVATNWSGSQVPGPADDVIIDRGGATPTITVRDARAVKSLLGREAIVVTSEGRLQVDAASQIESSELTLSGQLVAQGTLTIQPTGKLNWLAGSIAGNGLVNNGVLALTGPDDKLALGSVQNNATVLHQDTGRLLVNTNTVFTTASTGVYEFTGDGSVGRSVIGGGFHPAFLVEGTLRKSGGTGTSLYDGGPHGLDLQLTAGKVEVQIGRLKVDDGGIWQQGTTITVGQNAVLDINADRPLQWSGTVGGSGTGRVELTGGSLSTLNSGATLNFSPGLFQWLAGALVGTGAGWTNSGTMTLAGPADKVLVGQLQNSGGIVHQDHGQLLLNGNSVLINGTAGIYDFLGDGDIGPSGIGAGFTPFVQLEGLLRKSAGTDQTSEIGLALNTTATAVIESLVGRLKLAGSGVWNGGTFRAAADALVDIAGNPALIGTFTGTGAGRVELSAGLRPADGGVNGKKAIVNFAPGLLHWTGGSISGGGCNSTDGCSVPLTNTGEIVLAGPHVKSLSANSLINQGTLIVTGTGAFAFGNGNVVDNHAGGVIEIRGDVSFESHINPSRLLNAGTVRKTGGNGAAEWFVRLDNASTGKIETRAGRIRLLRGGTSRGMQFDLVAGTGIDMAGDHNHPFFLDDGTYTGTGLGTIDFSGQIQALGNAAPLFNFPPGMFQWHAGTMFWRLVNNGEITLNSAQGVFARIFLTNNGTFVHRGPGNFALNPDSFFENNGLYDFQSDADLVVPDSGSTGRMNFVNHGTVRKSGGIGSSEFRLDATQFNRDLRFHNPGRVEAKSGTLVVHRPVPQVNNATLQDGTWHVGAFAALELPDVGDITVNRGSVILDGPGSTFANINSLSDNQGLFSLQGGRKFETSGPLLNSGELRVGPASVLTVAGDLTAHDRQSAVAWYRGENDAQDAMGGLHGTLQGTVPFAAGQFGQAFSLDGERDFVRIGNPPALRLHDFTIQAWVKRDSLSQAGGIFLYGFGGYGLGIHPTGELFLTAVGVSQVTSTQLRVNDLAFHHVAVTKAGSKVTFYVDGVAESVHYDPAFGFFSNVAIGARTDVAEPAFLGRIDEVAIFDRALDAAEINVLRTSNDVVAAGRRSSKVEIEIGGRPRAGQFGRLNVRGTARLNGRLSIARTDGFGPTPRDEYVVMSYVSRTGNFTALQGLAPFFTATVEPARVVVNGDPLAPSYDLRVKQVPLPATGSPGMPLTVSYQVDNLSPHAVGGRWMDSVYLSADATYSADDLLIGRVEHRGGVAANGSYIETLTALLPGTVDGDYHVIVIADSRGLIPDPDRSNNRAASTTRLPVSSTRLELGVTRQDTIANGEDKWYRLDVPAGGDLRFDVNFTQLNQAEFFVRYRQPPTRSEFDFTASNPLELQRRLTLASPQAGPYYILVHGREGAGQGALMQITASVIPLALNSVTPGRGANVGPVTATLRGAGFQPDTVVELMHANQTVVATASVRYGDANTLFATFNLTGVATGVYRVRARNAASSVTLDNAFEVTVGTPGRIVANISSPGSIRAGRQYSAIVTYENVGHTDVIAPLLVIQADNAQFKLSTDTHFGNQPLFLLGIHRQGPAGILPPQARGQFKLDFIPQGTTTWEVSGYDGQFVLDWDALKASLKPDLLPTLAWDALFSNFRTNLGDNIGQVQAVLAASATRLSELGQYTADVNRLLQFEIAKAGDFGAIGRRNTFGALGFGMPDPTVFRAVADASGNIRIQLGRDVRLFKKHGAGFLATHGDSAQLTRVGNEHHLREKDQSLTVFSSDGKLAYIEDLTGYRITAVYNGDRLTAWSDSFGSLFQYVYNAAGLITRMTDAVGRVTLLEYDAAQQHLVAFTDALGRTQFEYVTGQGPLREHALKTVILPQGQRSDYEYDAQGRLVSETRSGQLPITYEYDGARISIRQGAGPAFTSHRNDMLQMERVVDSLGNIYTFDYDPRGNLVRSVVPGRLATTLSYDGQNNLTQLTGPLGHTLDASWTDHSRLSRVRDPKGLLTSFDSDATGLYGNITGPDGQVLVRQHADGRIERLVDRRGNTADFLYGANGRLARIQVSDGSSTQYEYDDRGNLTRATNAAGSIVLEYTATDRLAQITYPNGRSVAYQYDALGRLSRRHDHSNVGFNYSYDAAGRMTAVRDDGNRLVAGFTYDNFGRVATRTSENGASTSYTYDDLGQVLSIVDRKPDQSLQSQRDYAYDALGRRTSETSSNGTTTYSYDELGQLTEVNLPGGRQITYEYDANGNRIAVNDNGVAAVYATNQRNQYTSSGTTTFAYDADGHLTSQTDATGTTTYTYNAEGRLVAANTLTSVVSLEYDALGGLAAVVRDGVRTEYLIDSTGVGQVFAQYGATGDLQAHYAFAEGLAAQVDAASNLYLYHADAVGNVTQLSDFAGDVVNQYEYLPFGESNALFEGRANPFRFNGQWGVLDLGGGRVHMRNRTYAPALGRFAEEDPLHLQGGDVNLYRFANNDPVNQIDPLGLYRQRAEPPLAELDVLGRLQHLADQVGTVVGSGVELLKAGASAAVGGFLMNLTAPSITIQGAAGAVQSVAITKSYGSIITRTAARIFASRPDFAGVVTNPLGKAVVAGGAASSAIGIATAFGVGYSIGSALRNVPIVDDIATSMACSMTNVEVQDSLGDRTREGLANGLIKFATTSSGAVSSDDPNDITGPAGVGPLNHVAEHTVFPYTVRFENVPTATAAAQEVFITLPLDPDLDWTTVELGNVGFGSIVVQVPAGRNFYQTQVSMPASAAIGGDPLLVDIVGGIDLGTGVIRWTFTALDPRTGDLPENALAGFLPPNDAQGVGQGFVDLVVRPRANLPTGTRIDAQATIVFDTNDPLDTPAIFHTIDAGAPSSHVLPLPVRTGLTFPVTWDGADDAGGVGVRSFDILVSENGGPYQVWLADTTARSSSFSGVAGRSYAFYSVAQDHVGHVELAPLVPDATTTVARRPWQNPTHAMDVSNDGVPNVPDLLLLLRRLGANGSQSLPAPTLAFQPPPFYDVSGDDALTPFDVTLQLLFLRGQGGNPEPELAAVELSSQRPSVVDYGIVSRLERLEGRPRGDGEALVPRRWSGWRGRASTERLRSAAVSAQADPAEESQLSSREQPSEAAWDLALEELLAEAGEAVALDVLGLIAPAT